MCCAFSPVTCVTFARFRALPAGPAQWRRPRASGADFCASGIGYPRRGAASTRRLCAPRCALDHAGRGGSLPRTRVQLLYTRLVEATLAALSHGAFFFVPRRGCRPPPLAIVRVSVLAQQGLFGQMVEVGVGEVNWVLGHGSQESRGPRWNWRFGVA